MRRLVIAALMALGVAHPVRSQAELEFFILAEEQARLMAPVIGWGYECGIPETSLIRLTYAKTMRLLRFTEGEMRMIDALMTSYDAPGTCPESSKLKFGENVQNVLQIVTEWHDEVAASGYVEHLQ